MWLLCGVVGSEVNRREGELSIRYRPWKDWRYQLRNRNHNSCRFQGQSCPPFPQAQLMVMTCFALLQWLSRLTRFQLVFVIVCCCRICLSQTTPWKRVSFSHLLMFAGTGTGTGTGTRRSSSRASHSHRPRQLCEWGFHTAEISEFLCFPWSQGSSQCFSCPRWSHCSTHHRRDASIQAYLPRQGS